jgi:hypothetical protein
LLRFLKSVEENSRRTITWRLSGVSDPLMPVYGPISVSANWQTEVAKIAVDNALNNEKQFVVNTTESTNSIGLKHQMGWRVELNMECDANARSSIPELADSFDPLA